MVAVVNFGGQYAHLIARRIRELGVKSELVRPDIKIAQLSRLKPQALIFSGSPSSVLEKNAPKPDPEVYKLKLPILGICYGHQLMGSQLGGKVASTQTKQYGKETLKIVKSPLFEGLSSPQTVWFSHGDQVKSLPKGFSTIASTKNAQIAAMQDQKNRFFSVQFHPEVTHTPGGTKVLTNFLFKIAKSKHDWNLGDIKNKLIDKVKKEVGAGKLIMATSGGVDSTVAASIINKAIGDKLYLVLVDTGLLRKSEVREVKNIIAKIGLKNLMVVNAKNRFLEILKDVVDPEEKRKKIAKLYFAIFEEVAKETKGVKFLGQGTIYPDRIESAITSKWADKIKSHHNVTLPKGLKLKIVEPLAELYKDEVRKIGQLLKIPDEFLNRHPFPGPGLAIRILGEVTEERLAILREADAIFTEELKKAGLYNKEVSGETSLRFSSLDKLGTGGLKVAQSFAALLPVKAVGVMGDARTYSYVISLRSVDTLDFMTADWSKIPHEILEKISSRIVNEVGGVNRVVYDITQKPPATIEYE